MSKKSPVLCNHANEVPAKCTCGSSCYCKSHTCKPSVESKKNKTEWKRVDPPWKGKNFKIEMAPDGGVLDNWPNILKLLKLLGHPEALVTDLSSVGDFCPSERKLRSVSKHIGFKITDDDILVDVAKKMSDGKQ